jgi:hypothetical protein
MAHQKGNVALRSMEICKIQYKVSFIMQTSSASTCLDVFSAADNHTFLSAKPVQMSKLNSY